MSAVYAVGTNPTTLYTISGRGVDDRALYRSSNFGETWTRIDVTETEVTLFGAKTNILDPRTLAVDPRFPTRLYVSVYPPNSPCSVNWRLFQSVDAGDSWAEVGSGREYLRAIGSSPLRLYGKQTCAPGNWEVIFDSVE
jgi:hypothetical protein